MSNESIWLENVYVSGLHGVVTINAHFEQGINVVYGENGAGKTTLLHIISNIANCDFNRFRYIEFREIILKMSDNTEITVVKIPKGESPKVLYNGNTLSISRKMPNGSEAERTMFTRLFGKRPVYAPAFRNVLQKMEDHHRFPLDNAHLFHESVTSDDPVFKEGESIVSKTAQCRNWFGNFVPIIRCPSVEEAEADLERYWVRVDNLARREKEKVISEATNDILAKLLGEKPIVIKEVIDDILEDFSEEESEKRLLGEHLAGIFADDSPDGIMATSRPTDLVVQYVHALIEAQSKGKNTFKKMDSFTSSMNKFLGPDLNFTIGGKFSKRQTPKLSYKNGKKRDYYVKGMSSGERQLFTLLFTAWQGRDESSLMLIDEPEISLHIDWQRKILEEMYKQCDQQIIACTHAPEIAADLPIDYQIFDNFSFTEDRRG